MASRLKASISMCSDVWLRGITQTAFWKVHVPIGFRSVLEMKLKSMFLYFFMV